MELEVYPKKVIRMVKRGGAPSGKRPRARVNMLDSYKPTIDRLLSEGRCSVDVSPKLSTHNNPYISVIVMHLFSRDPDPVVDYAVNTRRYSMAFDSEMQLVDLFESITGLRLRAGESGLLTEFKCGDGIADVVLYELRKDWVSSLLLGQVPQRWAYALRNLPYRRNFTTLEFAEQAAVTRKTAALALRQYVVLGFCVQKGASNIWTKIRQPRPLVNRIYAVEAKLRDWKCALTQAVRYRDYANESWVLLDKHSIRPALENHYQFERLSVGLAGLSTAGEVTSYFTPPPLPPKSPVRFWRANAEIAHRLSSSF